MSDGYKIQKYLRCLEIVDECGLKIELYGDSFKVSYVNGQIAGMFNDVEQLFSFITGYAQGFEKGKFIQLKGE